MNDDDARLGVLPLGAPQASSGEAPTVPRASPRGEHCLRLDAVSRWIGIALLVVPGIAIAIAWGLGAFVVYAFFAAIAGAVAFGAAYGGGWLTGASRGRFDRRDR